MGFSPWYLVFFLSIFLINILLKQLNISKRIRYFSIFLGTIGLSILPYVYEFPFFSHIYEVAMFSAFLVCYLWIIKRKNLVYNYLLLGVCAGLLVLVRPTNILFIFIFLFSLLFQKFKFKKLLLIIVAGIPFLLVFLIYNKVSYGSFISSGYSALVNQSFDFHNFYIIEILFSSVRGWFVYTPIAILGIIGLMIWSIQSIKKKDIYRYFALSSLISIVLLIILYSFWPAWWAGDSIGNRFFLVVFPLIIVGFAKLITSCRSAKSRIMILLLLLISAAYSFCLISLIRITPMSSLSFIYPGKESFINKYSYVPDSEKYTPAMVFHYQYDLLNNAQNLSDYFDDLKSGLYGGRSLILLASGQTDPLINIELRNLNDLRVHSIPDNLAYEKTGSFIIYIKENNKVCEIPFTESFATYHYNDVVIKDDNCISGSQSYKLSPFKNDSSLKFVSLGSFQIAFVSEDSLKFINYKTEKEDD